MNTARNTTRALILALLPCVAVTACTEPEAPPQEPRTFDAPRVVLDPDRAERVDGMAERLREHGLAEHAEALRALPREVDDEPSG